MKITIVTACWKRPEIFVLFAKGVHHLIANTKCKIEVVVAGSEGAASKKMVEKEGFIYVEHPNQPLASKMNAAMKRAKLTDPDYVLCMGSDDVVHPSLMKVYEKYMKQGIDFIAVLDWYFFDYTTGRCSYWGGYTDYRIGHSCGAGRVISRKLMDKWQWSPWQDQHSSGLDNSMQRLIAQEKFSRITFSIKEHNAYGLDIKSSVNMTPFHLWQNTHLISTKEIKVPFKYLFE